MVYCDHRKLLKMISNLTVAPAAIIVMALVGVFILILPLGRGIFFWRKSKGQWRFFLISCVVFPTFALMLERAAHSFCSMVLLAQCPRGISGYTPCIRG